MHPILQAAALMFVLTQRIWFSLMIFFFKLPFDAHLITQGKANLNSHETVLLSDNLLMFNFFI